MPPAHRLPPRPPLQDPTASVAAVPPHYIPCFPGTLQTSELHYDTLVTLPKWLNAYASNEGMPPLAVTSDFPIFFTNFFVSRVDWWLRPDVQRFLQVLPRRRP